MKKNEKNGAWRWSSLRNGGRRCRLGEPRCGGVASVTSVADNGSGVLSDVI
jgi:hypothetical protein